MGPSPRVGCDGPAGGREVWRLHPRADACAVDFGSGKGGLKAGVLPPR